MLRFFSRTLKTVSFDTAVVVGSTIAINKTISTLDNYNSWLNNQPKIEPKVEKSAFAEPPEFR